MSRRAAPGRPGPQTLSLFAPEGPQALLDAGSADAVAQALASGPDAPNRLKEPLDAQIERVLQDPAAAGWQPMLEAWQHSEAGRALQAHLQARQSQGAAIYPAQPFRALGLTPLASVRVIILGQDPYHGPGQAEGLAFSVPMGVARPPSLRNLDVELQRDLGLPQAAHGQLDAWARQGVLLLNTVLTVEDGQPGAHVGHGWEPLTQALLAATARDAAPKVYLLWGRPAQAMAPLIEAEGGGRHAVLRANHPSPLSARRPPVPFIGCGHFGQANAWLAAAGRGTVDWRR